MPKPFDKSFKLLTEDDPRAVLALVAGISLNDPIDVETLPSELNLDALQADTLFHCRTPDSEFLIHIESVTRFKRAVLDRQLDYVLAIAARYKLPCRSYLVLLTARGVPKQFPRYIRRSRGDLSTALRLRCVKLWRIPALRILRLNNPNFLPWVPLLKANSAELEEAITRVHIAGDPELGSHLAVFGGLRYGNKEAFLERLNEMLIKEEMLKESVTYQFIEEQGRKRGEEETLRKNLSKVLTERFGSLPAPVRAKLRAASVKELNRWFTRALRASTLAEALK